jgi:hypothetical protein
MIYILNLGCIGTKKYCGKNTDSKKEFGTNPADII